MCGFVEAQSPSAEPPEVRRAEAATQPMAGEPVGPAGPGTGTEAQPQQHQLLPAALGQFSAEPPEVRRAEAATQPMAGEPVGPAGPGTGTEAQPQQHQLLPAALGQSSAGT